MGGFFSTRWNWTATKRLTSSVPSLRVQRYWELLPVNPPYLYRARDNRQAIEMTTTPCTYGGERRWFVCPALRCQRRCGVLYRSGPWWLCRRCARLTYWTQRHDRPSRLHNKAAKLGRRLGIPAGSDAGPRRPHGMHHTTYNRLVAQWQDAWVQADMAAEDALLEGVARYLARRGLAPFYKKG